MWQFHLCWHCHCPDIYDSILSICTFSFVCCICCLPSAFVFCFLQNETNHRFTNVRRSKLVLTRCISYLTPCTDVRLLIFCHRIVEGRLTLTFTTFKRLCLLSHSQHRRCFWASYLLPQHGSRSSYITSCPFKVVLKLVISYLTPCMNAHSGLFNFLSFQHGTHLL